MKLTFLSLILFLPLTYLSAQYKINDNGAVVGFKAQCISSKELLVSQNEQVRLIPASLTKIITTATALELLGGDYIYQTIFYYSGKIIKGELFGNLIVKSSGDPTLGSKFYDTTKPKILFEGIKEELRRVGIENIKGNIIVKADVIKYSAPRLWEDMGNYYGASPKGFNWRDNTAEVILSSSKIGDVCKVVSIHPDIKPYTIQCKTVAAAHNNDSAYVFGVEEIKHWWIEGSIPKHRTQFKIKAALPNPSLSFKNELITFLKNEGVDVAQNIYSTRVADQSLLYVHNSPRLSEIIRIVNHKSNNLFADQLLLTLAKEIKGVPTWGGGNKVVEDYWLNKIEFKDNFRLRDGSGLTPKNLVSPKGMVQLLLWMQQNSSNYHVFEQSLAKGGESGTLRSVFKHPRLKGRIIGKSGSFEGVLGYCGYFSTSSGKKAAFCVIANNYLIPTKQVRSSMDEFITQIVLEE